MSSTSPYLPGNPFHGRNPDEVWKEIHARVRVTDSKEAKKELERILIARKKSK